MLPSTRHAAKAGWPWLQVLSNQVAHYSQQVACTRTFPLAPGGLLDICCIDPATTVNISNGAEDAVSLQVHQQEAPAPVEAAAAVSSSGNRFSMQLLETSRNPTVYVVETSAGGGSASGCFQLSAAMPSRFCGVSVSTAGGAVRAGLLQEAEMHVVSRGGAVAVKRCRATNAVINTAREPQQGGRGGDVQVGELSASVLRVSSGGGAVSLGRVFGLEAELLSEGGSINIAALYGRRAVLSSGGGVLSVAHMACDGLATVDSAGGRLAVDGLEGNASILSAGADIKVHLHERFGRVFVDSSGGDVEAWISPAAAVTLQVAAAGGIQLDPALKVTGELSRTALQGTTRGSSSSTTWSEQQQMQRQPDKLHGVAAAGDTSGPSGSSTVLPGSQNSSRLRRVSGEVAGMAAAVASHITSKNSSAADSTGSPGSCQTSAGWCSSSSSGGAGAAGAEAGGDGSSCSTAVRYLIINAGTGRVVLKAMSWMDALTARLQVNSS